MKLSHLEKLVAAIRAEVGADADPVIGLDVDIRGVPEKMISWNPAEHINEHRVFDGVNHKQLKGGDYSFTLISLPDRE